MRKIVVSVAAAVCVATSLSACRSAPSRPGGAEAGAASAAGAVDGFLAAARAGSMVAMAGLFGTTDGPITNRDKPNDVEKRMRALQCYLSHDTARQIDDAPGLGEGRLITVELRLRDLTRRTQFNTVEGPRHRWYVSSFDINAVADLCRP